MNKTIGLGIIGAGKFAEFCLEHCRTTGAVQPLGVWSRTPDHAKQFAERCGIRAYSSLDELLRDDEIELVHVATVPVVHAEQCLEAIHCGKHVLCEKPLATTVADAEKVVRAAHEHNVRLAVNFVMRYGPLWKQVRTIIDESLLGGPLRGEYTNCAGDSGIGPNHWFWDKETSGGIFVEHGVHAFDLLRSWLGDGRVLSAHQHSRPGADRIDQVQCEVQFDNETTIGFYHGFHQPNMLDRQELRLVFERGVITLPGWIFGEIQVVAALDDCAARRIMELFPNSWRKYDRDISGGHAFRDGNHHIDGLLELKWRHAGDKQALYGAAVAALIKDLAAGIRNSDHVMRVTPEDGLAATRIAVDAERCAVEGA